MRIRPRASTTAGTFTPPQVAQVYNFPTAGNGAGQTIAILELGGGYTTTDITNYFKQLGLTAPKVTAVVLDGGANAPGDPNGADGEVMLDIEVAGSVAPGANIVVLLHQQYRPGIPGRHLDCLARLDQQPQRALHLLGRS